MRRSLWRPLPADTILDDVLAPMRCVLAGYRVVFNERARAFDRAAPDADAEGRRKVRTLAGNYQILWLEPRLLLPWRNPVWLQFVSHKMGRLLVPYALLPLLAAQHAAAPAVDGVRRGASSPSASSICSRATARGSTTRTTAGTTRDLWAQAAGGGPVSRLAPRRVDGSRHECLRSGWPRGASRAEESVAVTMNTSTARSPDRRLPFERLTST